MRKGISLIGSLVVAGANYSRLGFPFSSLEEMVRGMRAGSVIVDLAAEQGGNCALTEPDRRSSDTA